MRGSAIAVLLLVHVASSSAELACSNSMDQFRQTQRPAGWSDSDQRFAVYKESEGHHHIICESAKRKVTTNNTRRGEQEDLEVTRATVEVS